MSETEHSPLLWTMEQDEPPDECWYVIQDGEGQVVCFATKDDAELIVRAVNTHQTLVKALDLADDLISYENANSEAVINYYGYNPMEKIKAALDAAKGGEE